MGRSTIYGRRPILPLMARRAYEPGFLERLLRLAEPNEGLHALMRIVAIAPSADVS